MASEKKILFLILPVILISVISGIWLGWIRIGWAYPMAEVAGKHGAIMTGSFLGTLICLERAVIIKKKWILLVPLMSGSSIFFFLKGFDQIAYFLITFGSIGQVIILYYISNLHKDFFLRILLAGAISWMVGNLMLIFHSNFLLAVPFWIGFLLMTIIAERIELSRYLPVSKFQKNLLIVALVLFVVGIVVPFHDYGRYLSGAAMLISGFWLLKNDMARKSVKKEGLHRYSGLLLLTGYLWLGLSGILFLIGDMYGFIYDAVLHTFFIGFVFSMIFAHAPIVFPGVAGFNFRPFHPSLYIWAVLLQVSLLLRVYAALASEFHLRMIGGKINGIVIICFFINMVILFIREAVNARKEKSVNHQPVAHEHVLTK